MVVDQLADGQTAVLLRQEEFQLAVLFDVVVFHLRRRSANIRIIIAHLLTTVAIGSHFLSLHFRKERQRVHSFGGRIANDEASLPVLVLQQVLGALT